MPALQSSLPLASRLLKAGSALARLPARLRGLAILSRTRRDLQKLDDHLLRDIGLTRAEAMAEAARSVWDAPSHWKA